MKQFMNRVTRRAHIAALETKDKLRDNQGTFIMDNAVVFVLIIVLGGIALALLTSYLQTDLSAIIKSKISDFFS